MPKSGDMGGGGGGGEASGDCVFFDTASECVPKL